METQFTAQPKLFIGLDIHKQNWSVHLRTDLCDHKSFTSPPQPELLDHYVAQHFKDHTVALVYEAGCCGFSAARYFMNLGWQVLVVNPSDVPRRDKQHYQKTDQIDCRNLSKQLQAGQLRGIFIPDEQQDQLKSLVRQRADMSRQLRAVKSSIKALLLYHGIEIPASYDNPNWSAVFLDWLGQLNWKEPTGKACLESKLRNYRFVYGEYLQVANQLRAYCRRHFKQDYYLLKSIPGVGGYLASVVLAEVGDLRRFNTQAQFASYVGLVPVIYNSGATESIRGVTPRCRSLLRSYVIESAWVALRLDPAMQAYYRSHVKRNPKSVIIKIAHKLLNRMLAVIKTNTPYQCSYSFNNGLETNGNQAKGKSMGMET